jgi:hypothetical protein
LTEEPSRIQRGCSMNDVTRILNGIDQGEPPRPQEDDTTRPRRSRIRGSDMMLKWLPRPFTVSGQLMAANGCARHRLAQTPQRRTYALCHARIGRGQLHPLQHLAGLGRANEFQDVNGPELAEG